MSLSFGPVSGLASKTVQRNFLIFGVLSVAVALAGCSSKNNDPFAGKGSPIYSKKGPIPKGTGRKHVGNPYEVAGRKFFPKEEPDYDKVGIASWYGPKFHRRMTSNGEWFDQEYRSAAHQTLPLPSYAKVTNLENGREMIVRINDRGPFVGDRIIDLSKKSAELLGFKRQGKANVRVQYIGPAPLRDKGTHLAAMNQELKRGTGLTTMIAAADARTNNKVYEGDETAVASNEADAPVENTPSAPGYFVQVAAYSQFDNAQRARQRLSQLGPLQITPVNASIGTIYRVRLGPLRDVAVAQNALQQVVEAGHSDARVVLEGQ